MNLNCLCIHSLDIQPPRKQARRKTFSKSSYLRSNVFVILFKTTSLSLVTLATFTGVHQWHFYGGGVCCVSENVNINWWRGGGGICLTSFLRFMSGEREGWQTWEEWTDNILLENQAANILNQELSADKSDRLTSAPSCKKKKKKKVEIGQWNRSPFFYFEAEPAVRGWQLLSNNVLWARLARWTTSVHQGSFLQCDFRRN